MNSVCPTFTIEKDNPPATLEHCFLKHMLVDLQNPPALIKGNNGSIYQAIYDSVELPLEGNKQAVPVIVSFQKHSYGKFAIVRNLRNVAYEIGED